MSIKDYLMVLALVGLTAFLIIGGIKSLSDEYGVNDIDLSSVEKMNNIKDIKESTENLYNIVAQPGSITPGGIFAVIFYGIGNFFMMIFKIVTLPFVLIKDLIVSFGLPIEIATVITTMIILSITFAVISAILRKNI